MEAILDTSQAQSRATWTTQDDAIVNLDGQRANYTCSLEKAAMSISKCFHLFFRAWATSFQQRRRMLQSQVFEYEGECHLVLQVAYAPRE
ncbi:hypothetical protein ACQRIU_002086 [Beauveria bassiana]